MNLLIKGDCDACGHNIQFLPEEGAVGSYKATCFLVGEDPEAAVPEGCAATGSVTAAAAAPAAATKPATSTRSTSTTPPAA